MPSQKAIRQKIKSVRNIQKITRAMKMVSAAKLKRVQERVGLSRPYSQKMRDLVSAVAPFARDVDHPLLKVRETKNIGVVVLTGDKGLCGSYNNNIMRKTVRALAEFGKTPFQLMTIGRKGHDFFRRREYPVTRTFPLPGVNAAFSEIQAIADSIAEWYTSGTVDAVYIAYTVFKSPMSQKAELVKFLPIEPPKDEVETASASNLDYIFEPAAPELLGNLLPRFLRIQVYQYLLESMTSEQGARMTAMSSATENAGELIDSLTLAYNKARQWAITKELLDIVGGAEALKSAN
jgi:F-type H+-transporting ATPase subunit gamma